MAWRPLLVGELEARARDRIAAAAEAVDRASWADPGLDRGAAGAALLFGCMARDGYQDAGGRAAELLEAAVGGLSSAQVSPWLFGGVTGVAWALEHLSDVVEIDPDALDDIDDSVLELVGREELLAPAELVEGLVGLGVYALERLPRPAAGVMLTHTVAQLATAPTATAGGLAHGG
ncbi:MAG TPA: lanthionine synthetase LanC family protein, partial [Kofleriaceae bacterium]|nr:lanthionine synthetase LanC family protein [Kofleriaceae bacterium]